MNDEKTTEIEIPAFKLVRDNVVRVDFAERRKPETTFRTPPSATEFFSEHRPVSGPRAADWSTPWWVRLAALVGILLLSLFVL
jgi:hypothetical protein